MLYDRHTRSTWASFADCYIRSFRKRALPNGDYEILTSYEGRGEGLSYLLQFDKPLMPHNHMDHRVAPSFAPMVFPYLMHPRLLYSIIIHRELKQRRWMEENLESIATIIDAGRILYVTTNDPHDMTLLKLRFQEYHAEPAIT